jgi:EmrB/QacA subfamily drug resistance transporter
LAAEEASGEERRLMSGAQRRYVLIACMMAQFMAAVESTIVGTAMPTIVADLGGFHLFSWVFASYLLAAAASTPIYGRLADLYGRKRVFIAGAALFLVASAACGFAWGMVPLIILRAIQGLGAGAIQPIAWTVLGDIYPPRERAIVQSYLSAVFGASAIGGPLLGGFIVEHWHWSIVFWINVPVSLATMAMLAVFLRETVAPRRHEVDYLGAVLLMLGIGALMVVIVQMQNLSAAVLMSLGALAAVALFFLVLQERQAREPIVPFRLWRMPIIAVGNAGSFVIGALMMCNGAFLPTYVQGAVGGRPGVVGPAPGAPPVTWTAGTYGAGKVMIGFSYRLAALVGGIIMIIGIALLLGLEPAQGALWAAIAASVLGLGMGFSNTVFVIAVQTSVGWDQRGAATSANMFLRTIGQSIGTGIFGAVFNFGMAAHIAGANDEINILLQPETRDTLGAAEIARLSAAIGSSIHQVYWIAGVLAVILLVLGLCIPAGLSPVRAAKAPHPNPPPQGGREK